MLHCVHSHRFPVYSHQGRIQDFGKGGSDKYIHNWGEGTGGGVPPPVTAGGSGGALIAPPVGSGAKPQPLFAFAFI